ncbi:prostaglandin reductase 1-like [Haliotis cracherodii]|uniref:prostaglandin reductase 1-like n=1 Tax=Haliotis cracherodii TaxID=6455 RepID=UPI0039EB9E79
MVKGKAWVLAKTFEGEPTEANFRLIDEEIPAPKQGEFVTEAVCLTVDPYMRTGMAGSAVGKVLMGEQVSRVTESKNSEYPVGALVQCYSGWRSRSLVNPKENPEALKLLKVPNLGGKDPSIALGVIGMTGVTAYLGFLEVCQPKAGDTVLVSGAAGAVGSVVGQIAKIKGCRVIGSAGSKQKCDWLKSLGFDYVFNYKDVKLDDALKAAAPKGIDCFYDNVGGENAYRVLEHMNNYGRMCVGGAISTYNTGKEPLVPSPFLTILFKRLKVQGFVIFDWDSKFQESRTQLLRWVNEGKLKYRETVHNGFDNMPKAFVSLFSGANTGKMIVKV